MLHIDFPEHTFNIKNNDKGGRVIFDFIRKKYVSLTPEEWVRQHILVYLHFTLHYPKGLIAVEKEISLNQLKKRYDIVVFSPNKMPWMLIECKQTNVPITDSTLQQLLQYYQIIQSPYWMLTNGQQHYCAHIQQQQVTWLQALPPYDGSIFSGVDNI
jgi:hypothetical protein